jgi:hypothetical protein
MSSLQKKKEFPRKRKRYLKKIILFSLVLVVVLLVLCGTGFYIIVVRLQKPLYISPLASIQYVQNDQSGKIYDTLQQGLKKDQIDYTSIDKANDSYVVTLQDGGKVTFSSQKDIMTQIASLQYILSHLTMEGREFSELDLRFDKPVMVLKP